MACQRAAVVRMRNVPLQGKSAQQRTGRWDMRTGRWDMQLDSLHWIRNDVLQVYGIQQAAVAARCLAI